MMISSTLLSAGLAACLFGISEGFWPFAQVEAQRHSESFVKQVAIIGAGPAGSSAAYYLEQFAKRDGLELEITVFERRLQAGGRSTTVNAYNDPSQPVELGASIFIESNRILKDASVKFNLSSGKAGEEEAEVLGIWNGENFVFTQKDSGWAWWDTAKILWKYGLAPIRTQRLMKGTVGDFFKLYDPPFFPFRSLSERAQDLGLNLVTAMTGEEYLSANQIGPPFSTDIIQASTRVNYGQNLGIIHGLEAMVCMAIEGVMQIKGGNWQIFDRMLNASNANVSFGTAVTGLTKEKGKYILETTSATGSSSATEFKKFDTVILAAPLQFSNLTISEDVVVKYRPDEIPYVTLHVTLFASPLRFSGKFFGLEPGSEVPTTVLTTLAPEENSSDRDNIVGKPGFFSFSTIRTTVHPKTGRLEYIYKIFSPKAITSKFLGRVFDVELPSNLSDSSTLPNEHITWFYPHVWQAYPFEFPRVTFDDPEVASGLYYTSGMESFISTMETSALMGMNVAQLIIDDLTEIFDRPDKQKVMAAEEL